MIVLDPEPKPIDLLPRCGRPDDIALEDRAGTLSYAELERAVASVAAWLTRQGLAPGARIASWLPKTRAAAILPLAVPRAGMVHVPVNPLLKRAQVAHILADSGASLLLTQPARATTLEPGDLPPGCRSAEETDLPFDGTGVAAPDADPNANTDPNTLAAILYTSGSTGRPKGVMLSHANLWLGAISVAHYLGLEPDDHVLGVLPFSFDYGQNQLFSTWAAGARVIPLDYLTPRDVIKAVERYGITTLAGVPPLWVQLLEGDWLEGAVSPLKRLTNSGGALTARLVSKLRDRFPAADLYAMYGLTEAFRSTYLPPALIDAHPDAIGNAIPFAEIMVVRADGSEAAAGEAGELVHAGPLVAQGYWHDAERTAQRFRPAPAFSAFGGTAVWSGDTVVRGVDGLLRFVGRDDEMIKSAGNRISPTEVEDAVLAGSEVLEAVALGVPDERLGQAVLVVARATGDPVDAEQALRVRLRRDLPNFMQPAIYQWRDALPRNANGKIDRAALKHEVAA